MAVRFDAAADRLLRTSGLLNTNAAYTAAFWIYLTSDLNAYEHVFGTNINSGANNFEYVGFDDNNVSGTLPRLCLLVDNGSYVEVSGSRLALSTWHYIAVIRSSTTNLSLYLNGGTTADVTNTKNVSSRTTATRMELGAFGTGNGDRFDGRIANLKIWDTNLTAQEAADERFTVEPLRKTNLWGWYPLLSSSDIADWSGNGRDWTAGGTLTTEDHPPRPFSLFVPQIPFAVVASAGSITGELSQTLANVTVSATGSSGVSGTLAATLGNVTSAATGTLAIAGTAANTLANVTSSAAGAVAITGALSQTLGNVTVSAAGAVALQASLAQTLGNVTVASAGVVAIAASASNTLGDVTVSSAGVITIEGELSATLGDVTVSSTGELVAEGTGTLSQTLANVTVTSTGTLALAGALTATLDNVTSNAAGTVALTGALAATLADVTVSASGVLIDGGQGALVATLGDVTSSAAGTLAIAAAAANTLDSVTVIAVGRVAIVGSLSATLGAVTVAAVGTDVLSPTPDNRIYRVPDEERVYQVSAESRVYTVE